MNVSRHADRVPDPSVAGNKPSIGIGIERSVEEVQVVLGAPTAGSLELPGRDRRRREGSPVGAASRRANARSSQFADRIPHVNAIDRAFFGYFGMKLANERAAEESGIGCTALRATRFHHLILMVGQGIGKLRAIPTPTGSRFQPVDASEVAEWMAELALGEPSGLVPDLAGPKIYIVAELVKSYLSAAGRLLVVDVLSARRGGVGDIRQLADIAQGSAGWSAGRGRQAAFGARTRRAYGGALRGRGESVTSRCRPACP